MTAHMRWALLWCSTLGRWMDRRRKGRERTHSLIIPNVKKPEWEGDMTICSCNM